MLSPNDRLIDEIEPCEYSSEVRRVDKALSAEFSRNESPSLGTHAVINVIDLVVVAVSCAPFLALIALTNGSFASIQTRAATIAVIAIVSLFYLGLTHCFCGRTVGMMLTIRDVDANSFENPLGSALLSEPVFCRGATHLDDLMEGNGSAEVARFDPVSLALVILKLENRTAR